MRLAVSEGINQRDERIEIQYYVRDVLQIKQPSFQYLKFWKMFPDMITSPIQRVMQHRF